MASLEVSFLQGQLEERKRRLEMAIISAPRNPGLAGLLHEVDSALDRMTEGTYGLCLECHDSVEQDRLLADPLVRYCLDHLTQLQRSALQRDLDLASQVQRNLLPQKGLRAGGWETSYHFEPVGAVSGDYCDLISSDGQLLFMLGDVSGKGVAASMLMAQLHALFRSLTQMSLPLAKLSLTSTAFSAKVRWRDSTPRWSAGWPSQPGKWKSITPATAPQSSLGAKACIVLNRPVCRWGCSWKRSFPPRACNWKPATRSSFTPTVFLKPPARAMSTA